MDKSCHIWCYVDRTYLKFVLPASSVILDVISHHKYHVELEKWNKMAADAKGDALTHIVQLITRLTPNNYEVDLSKYVFSCCNETIEAHTSLSALLARGYGEDPNNAISIVEKVSAPPAKRLKTCDTVSPNPPCCSNPPSELNPTDLNKLKEVKPYYHWMALLLRDKFKDEIGTQFTLDGVSIDVPTQALDTIVEQFALAQTRTWENESDFASQVNRYLDRFYFDDAHQTEGAVLGQYPLEATRRGDSCIVLYGNDWTIKHPVLATNDSKLKLDDFHKAEKESRLYSICSVTKCSYKFPYMFSLPLCPSCIRLEMHIVVNQKMNFIGICKADLWKKDDLKRFFILTYGLVRWATTNDHQRESSVPMAITPKKGLELSMKVDYREVFVKDDKVYKFFVTDGSKKPNADMMTLLGVKNVEVERLSKEYCLLSYSLLNGRHEPSYIEQFVVIAQKLEMLHGQGMVHGDVRLGNLLFGQSKQEAYLIDFDYTAECGTPYPYNYNTVPERHESARGENRMEQVHDWYSLIYLLLSFFPSGSRGHDAIEQTPLQRHLEEHKVQCLLAMRT